MIFKVFLDAPKKACQVPYHSLILAYIAFFAILTLLFEQSYITPANAVNFLEDTLERLTSPE